MDAIVLAYPSFMKSAGIGGVVVVWLFIDKNGAVRDARVGTTSGQRTLDDAALSAARVFRFSPALNDDEAVSVWVQLPITFSVP